MPAILKLIDQIRHRQLGAVQHVTVMYNLPIAALDAGIHSHWMFGKPERILMELGPHPLSVIHRLLGPVQAGAASVAGKRILKHGGVFYDTWQTSLVCDRGTAQMVVAAGGEFLSTWVYVLGQDGEAFVDLRRNTIRVSGNSPYLRTAGLRDGFRNGGALIRQSLGNFIAQTKGSLGLARAYELQTFSMNDSIRAFYAALLTDAKLPVDGADGAAVVRACEIVTQSALQFVEKGATPVGSI
jgi:predicted dehydrogenase